MNVIIRKITLDELSLVTQVLNHIPEFDAIFYETTLRKRLEKPESIILIAEFEGKPVGCKVAYNRYFDGSIYSWLGGVLPDYRCRGIAKELLNRLEIEAERKLFLSIRMKTRNKHIDMLGFALKNGFQICGYKGMDNPSESRIELIKTL